MFRMCLQCELNGEPTEMKRLKLIVIKYNFGLHCKSFWARKANLYHI
jgi:hypothetical protein